MPRTLLKYWIPLASLGIGVLSGVWASGVRVGQTEHRVAAIESRLESACTVTQAELQLHDERIRLTEDAVATIPAMATDLREIRQQQVDMMELLIELNQNR